MEAVLLLVAGATVALLGVLLSQVFLRSREQLSLELFRHAIQMLSSSERETQRTLAMDEMALTLKKLDQTVANLFVMVNNRTVLQRELQHGEIPPGGRPGPVVRTPWNQPQPPAPPAGLEGTTVPNDATPRHGIDFGERT